MKLRFYSRIHWRGLLPGLYLSWEETTMAIVLYLDGPGYTESVGLSMLSVEAKVEVPQWLEGWLLPRWERWTREREWVN